jgi:outer membrane protein
MQELQETYQKIQNFQQTAGQELQRTQESLLAPIMEKLQAAIKAVGAEGGYTFIYDMSMGVVLYTGVGAEDVTPLVKAKLGIK